MTTLSLNSLDQLLESQIVYGAFLCTLMLLGSYPMTQVFQHEEDAKRGDLTLSRILGIKGLFFSPLDVLE